jgi:tripartite-type tricarboxylate transporter receptor subunit TctC
LKDLVTAAKTKPGGLAYASAGHGSTVHFATEQFAHAAGIKLLHVPYKGGAPAATAIASGDVPGALVALSAIKSIVDSGRVKLLAVTSASRAKTWPDVPTVKESGVLDFEATIWTGLFVPKGTPDAIVSRIRADVVEALKDPKVVQKLEAIGADPATVSGDAFAQQISREKQSAAETVKATGIRLD